MDDKVKLAYQFLKNRYDEDDNITSQQSVEVLYQAAERAERLAVAVNESIMEMRRHGVCCRKFLEDALKEWERV